MTTRCNWISLVLCCVLPAISVRTTHSSFVASFFYACEQSHPAPRVRTTYTAAGRPVAHPALSPVEVYEHGQMPVRRYQLVGEVQVLASSGRTTVQDLTDCAIKAARKMAGDAIVDVSCCDAASAQPRAGDVGLLYLTARVARWE